MNMLQTETTTTSLDKHAKIEYFCENERQNNAQLKKRLSMWNE